MDGVFKNKQRNISLYTTYFKIDLEQLYFEN